MRKTPLVMQLRGIFATAEQPLSVPQLLEILAEQDLHPSKTSLYRMLVRMQDEGEICEILLDSRTAFYEKTKNPSHYHLSCEKCQATQCVEIATLPPVIAKASTQIQQRYHWQIHSHQFSLSGICVKCAKN